MEQFYFDQNITKQLCNNPDFSNQFFKQFKSPPKLIITPFSLIELSGSKIMDCLKESSKYNLDLSDSLKNQAGKACKYYESRIREDIITFLEKGLKEQEKYAKTEPGKYLFIRYKNYLNSKRGREDICWSILWDRISAMPLEKFKSKNTHLYISSILLDFFSANPHIPCLRLLIKSYKKLPPNISEKLENEFRKPLKKVIETSDLAENHDLVDTEMIQFAVMGYDDHPVHFYTKDNSEKIKKRLFMLYELLKHSKSWTQELLRDGKDILDTNTLSLKKIKSVASRAFIFGKISIVDNFGYIKEDIDVSSFLTAGDR